MAISFIGSKEFDTGTDAGTYTITDPLPTGLQTDDVCILAIASPSTATGTATMSGWTLVRQVNDGSSFHRGSIWYRVIQAGDTTTTDFTFDPAGTPEGMAWISSLYRGVNTATPFAAEDAAFSANDADFVLATPTVNNPSADNWVLAAGLCADTTGGDTATSFTCSPTGWTATERNDIDQGEVGANHGVGFYDSNGTVAAGNVSASLTLADTIVASDQVSWIGVLQPPAATTIPHRVYTVSDQAVNRSHYW